MELDSYLSFRFVPDIESLGKQELLEHGYYRGYDCAHGHNIRDVEKHWCYHCVQKITSNVCGFDINYLDPKYRQRYLKLWAKIGIKNFDECWEVLPGVRKRMSMPSYRSHYSADKTANVTLHKLIYQCAWGDIGSCFVTRICRNPNCVNPLHLFSSWNRLNAPLGLHPFVTDVDPKKLMHAFHSKTKQPFNPVVQDCFKATIKHPNLLKNNTDYDEEQMCYVIGDGT